MLRLPANLVDVKDLHFSYGALPIFRGLTLEIPRGKLVAVLGASGCGKSTLLKLVGGQLRPARGTVTVLGKNVHRLDTDGLYALRRHMGMMFQSSGLFSDLTVFENIAFPLRELYPELPESLIRPLVLMKLHSVGLRGAHALRTGDLSGGMTRRVALARATATDPALVLYDEPFAGLDPITLNMVAELIRRMNDALGTTSVVVTYDVSESLKLVDYVYVIADGVVAGKGTPEEVMASDDPYLSQFLHARPDGPVRFHMRARPLDADFRLSSG